MEVEENQADSVQMLESTGRPWGFWATIGFSCAIGVVCFVLCVVIGVGYVIASKVRNPELDIMELANSMESSGTFFAVTGIIFSIPVIGLVLLFSKIRRNMTVGDYLYLRWPERNQFVKWCLIVVLYAGIVEAITYALTFTGRPFVSEFMVNTFSNVSLKSVLLFAVLISAPLSEELMFRGFMFRGIESSQIGAIGAAIITSLLWALMHTQYDAIIIAGTFVEGLLLSWALVKTRSIYVPIAMHMLWNLIASIEIMIYLKLT